MIFFFLSINILFIIFLKKISTLLQVYDYPDERKVHTNPIPRLGGLLIYLNFIMVIFIFFNDKNFISFFLEEYKILFFFIAATCVFLIGFIDDKRNLSGNFKFISMIVLIGAYLFFDDSVLLNSIKFYTYTINFIFPFNYFFSILCFVAFVNAFNMFDGINGQCGTYSLFIFLFFYNLLILEIFIILIICLVFFLFLNFQSKIFLGDSGSMLLSFIISAFFIKFNNDPTFYIRSEAILLIMLIPGIDMIRLYFVRLKNKKDPFKADKNHLHHILLKKYNKNITFLIIQLIILIPNLISIVYGLTTLMIFFSITCYFSLIYFCSKFPKKNLNS